MDGRAIFLERNGVLSGITERAVSKPGPGQLLLQVHATSINFHDLIGIDGGIPGLPLPRVPFSDASATVAAVGDGVSNFAVGDPVIPNFFPYWHRGPVGADQIRTVVGDHIDGALQTHLHVPADGVARAPRGLSHEQIATLGCAALAAWRALVVEAHIQPGQTVVLQGTGGVSLAALSFAKMLGARVCITSSSDEKLEKARHLGADVTINYRETPRWHEAVLEQTDGRGADLVVEVGGGSTLAQSLGAVATGGHISVIGVLSGFEAASFPLAYVIAKNVALKGVTVGSVADLDAMCRAIEQNGYSPVIDSVYDLGSASDAVAAMKRQNHFGKIVIRTD